MLRKVNIYPAYIIRHNLNHEKQIILLMNPNPEGWHYLVLLRGVMSKHVGGGDCLNGHYLFKIKS